MSLRIPEQKKIFLYRTLFSAYLFNFIFVKDFLEEECPVLFNAKLR